MPVLADKNKKPQVTFSIILLPARKQNEFAILPAPDYNIVCYI
jgi:hypothetical protein